MYISEDHCTICDAKTTHINHKCCRCLEKESVIKGKSESERWNSLTIEQKLDEIKQRLDNLNDRDMPYGGQLDI